jgi:hypothetical protein
MTQKFKRQAFGSTNQSSLKNIALMHLAAKHRDEVF